MQILISVRHQSSLLIISEFVPVVQILYVKLKEDQLLGILEPNTPLKLIISNGNKNTTTLYCTGKLDRLVTSK